MNGIEKKRSSLLAPTATVDALRRRQQVGNRPLRRLMFVASLAFMTACAPAYAFGGYCTRPFLGPETLCAPVQTFTPAVWGLDSYASEFYAPLLSNKTFANRICLWTMR